MFVNCPNKLAAFASAQCRRRTPLSNHRKLSSNQRLQWTPKTELVHRRTPVTAVDLRSDTVTRPSQPMLEAMNNALLGDDFYEDDPTVKHLEAEVALIAGKEAGLFFPTGTMSNLTAVMAWCDQRGSEVLLGNKSHIFVYEQAGIAQFGGISPMVINNNANGTFCIDELKERIRSENVLYPVSRLIAVENTFYGRVVPQEFIRKVADVARSYSMPLHMDGARLWNAATASQLPLAELTRDVDTISLCLSKGLGAPAGSVLVGPASLIHRARHIRKGLGGGMRQVGLLAAAGMVALRHFLDAPCAATSECIEHNIAHLNATMESYPKINTTHFSNGFSLDHIRARRLACALTAIPELHVDLESVETNMIFVDLVAPDVTSDISSSSKTAAVVERLQKAGVLCGAYGTSKIRLVVHRDISDADIDFTIGVFQSLFER